MRSIRFVLVLGLAMAGRAAALEYGHRDHAGPYLHFDLGLAGLQGRAGETFTTPEVTLSGGGLDLAIAGGWSIIPNLQLGAELWEIVTVQPDIEYGGGTATTDEDSSFALVGIGPRVTYWIAPQAANVYLSAAWPCFTRVSVDLNGHRGSTDGGLGGRFSVGKEWWLGRSGWGMGVAGHLLYSRNRDSGSGSPWWDTWGGAVSFSASWN